MSRRPRIPGMRSDRTLLILPSIPDDLPVDIKNALAIRNAASVNGICPDCGAIGVVEKIEPGISSYRFDHENDCTALTDEEAE